MTSKPSYLLRFLNAPRTFKRSVSVIYDVIAISLAFYLAYALRMGQIKVHIDLAILVCLGCTLVVSIYAFIRMGLYRAILRYMNQQAVFTIINGILISSLVLSLSGFFIGAFLPRSVPFIYILTALLLVGLPRLVFRGLVQMSMPKGATKVLIYGAGNTGNSLAAQLLLSGEFDPIGFVDDDKLKQGRTLRGLKIYPPAKLPVLIKNYGVRRVLLALGEVDRTERIRVVRTLEPLRIQVQTIPPLSDLVKDNRAIVELRNIEIEDILGRDPVAPNIELMSKHTTGKTVMVTGAGGSIGSELCRQLMRYEPRQIILFEQNEFNLYRIEKELADIKRSENLDCEIVPLLGSIQNESLVDIVMRQYAIHIVYHAAAYKHVPLVEQNVIEAVRNNMFGTKILAEKACHHRVPHFVLISTDKAVRPTNIMGATKRVAELILQDLAVDAVNTTFSMVRFGNVLDSSGSVVPHFREQIARGGPITVTHKDIVRYFMTIREAAQLVIQAGALAEGGDVFVLDMGDPIKIVDLAKDMALLSGYCIKDEKNPNGDIEIKYVGLRPGEKLYEELLVGDNCEGTIHPRILKANERRLERATLRKLLQLADEFSLSFRTNELFSLLTDADIEFNAIYELGDLVHKEQMINANVIPITNQVARNSKVGD